FSGGHVMRRPVQYQPGRLSVQGFSANLSRDFTDRWKVPGDEAITNIPSFVPGYTGRRSYDYYMNGDLHVIDASYIKLRDITFSYRLKPELLNIYNVQTLSLYVQTGNYMVWRANRL